MRYFTSFDSLKSLALRGKLLRDNLCVMPSVLGMRGKIALWSQCYLLFQSAATKNKKDCTAFQPVNGNFPHCKSTKYERLFPIKNERGLSCK